jgi:alkanesulfonate monooxygenase SsuD/methylene tetrahydromethanopterin reductase-like flavin-dependent oxidoreductase (luciferase family)
MTRVGAIFSPYPNPPEAFRDVVVAAEESGVAELWVWEDCFRESAFAQAAAALAWTSSLRIGIGIAPMPLRNVAVTAMEIATLERMFPGRLLPGVGHGVQSWMSQVGVRAASPLTLMREYVPALRRLLAGETVSVDGRYVKLDAVALDWPPAVVPRVYAAAEGPKTLHLSGEVADGTVLDSRRTPEEVGAWVDAVRAGRSGSGRDGAHDIVAYVVAAFGPDADEQLRAFAHGPDSSPADLRARAVGGSVEEVAEGVRRYAAVGVDDVVLLPTPDADLTRFLEATAQVGALVSAG